MNTFVFVIYFAHTYFYSNIGVCVGKMHVDDKCICLPLNVHFMDEKVN